MTTRRDFLARLGLGAAAGLALPIRSAFATQTPAGSLPNTYTTPSDDAQYGGGVNNDDFKVLEIFCQGGLSHEESLWMYSSDSRSYHSAASGNPKYSAPNWTDIDTGLGSASLVRASLDTSAGQYFSRMFRPITSPRMRDSGFLGIPLLDPALSDRMRVVALHHDQPPHVAAVPFALGGLTIGRPRRAGLGAAIEAAHGTGDPASPLSYVLYGDKGRGTAFHAAAYGEHEAPYMPVLLEFGTSASANDFAEQFHARRDEAADALWAHYQSAYAAKLDGSRSAGHDAYQAAAARLAAGQDLADKWTGIDFQVTETGYGGSPSSSASTSSSTNYTRSMLRAAAELLSSGGAAQARYVCVVDSGVGLDYDHHEASNDADVGRNLATVQAGSIWSTLDELADLCHSGAIDLDDTLVVINTEFGRWTRGTEAQHYGSDHNPEGYAVAVLGGPVATSGVGGAMSGGDATNDAAFGSKYTPTDLHAALLAAAGIDPYCANNLTTDETSLDNAADLATVFFGA